MTPPACTCCGKPRTRRGDGRGWNGCHDWCSACTERWRLAGKPADGPPTASCGSEKAARISAGLRAHHAACGQSQAALDALAAANSRRGMRHWHATSPASGTRRKADRLRDYAWLVGFGETRENAARRVGVSLFMALKYEQLIPGEGQADAA